MVKHATGTDDGGKPLRAYMCRSDDAETCEVRFAATNGAARFPFQRDHDVEYAEVRRAPEFDRFAPGPVPTSALFETSWFFECHHCSRRLSLDEEFVEDHPPSAILDHARRVAPHVRDLKRFDAENPEPPQPAADASHPERWAAEQKHREWRERRGRLAVWTERPTLSRKAIRIDDDAGTIFCDARCEQAAAAGRAAVDLAQDDALAEAMRRWPGCAGYEVSRWPYLNATVSFRAPGMDYAARWTPESNDLFVAQHDAAAWQAYLDGLPGPSVEQAA